MLMISHAIQSRSFRRAVATTLLLAGPVVAADPARPERLRVFPDVIALSSARDRQGMVVQAEYADGSTRDVTALATAVATPPVVAIADGVVAPKADGQGVLWVGFAGLSAEAPVEVRGAAAVEPLRFRDDVLAVLTRAGCNTGKCHGSASGKDGFRLLLFGYDPEGDHVRLTRESVGRRVNLASPADCLLLNKATGKVAHTGGQRLDPDGEGYQIVLAWLKAGAPADPGDAPRPVSLEVAPARAVLARPGETQRLMVQARYSDGADREVTRFTRLPQQQRGERRR